MKNYQDNKMNQEGAMPRQVDGIFPRQAREVLVQIAESPRRAASAARRGLRLLLTSKLLLIPVLFSLVMPMTAFEAHVVNVTAMIEGRPQQDCQVFEVRSMGFWKEHEELWMLPQSVGNTPVTSKSQAIFVFNAPNSFAEWKLKKQLLALKFNIAYYHLGDALVPGEGITIQQLADQADALLTAFPPASNKELLDMKDRVEKVNTALTVTTCLTCPLGVAKILDWNVEINSKKIKHRMDGNLNSGDHIKVTFTVASGCDNTEVSLVSYNSPQCGFNNGTAHEATVYDFQSGHFGPGDHSLEIDIPPCYYQAYFVLGGVLNPLGPAGTDNFYDKQDRQLDADSGGSKQCSLDSQSQRLKDMGGLSAFNSLLINNGGGDTGSSTPEGDEGQASTTPETTGTTTSLLLDETGSSTPPTTGTTTSDTTDSGNSDRGARDDRGSRDSRDGGSTSTSSPDTASTTPPDSTESTDQQEVAPPSETSSNGGDTGTTTPNQ